MKFGMFFIGSSTDVGDNAKALREVLDQIVYAEELGYDAVWFAEHHSSYGMLGSPAVIMAAAAKRTTRIRLGIAVSVLPFHNPVSVAEEYAMVDVLSGGRLDFAVGRGNQALEYHMMQADRDNSKTVFWEALEVIQGLWASEGDFSYSGQHFNFTNIRCYPRPLQNPVPTWVAAVTQGTFDETARRGYPIMTAGGQTGGGMEQVVANQNQARQALIATGANAAEIVLPMAMNTYIAATPQQARDEFRDAMWTQSKLIPVNPFAAATPQVAEASEKPDFAAYAKAAAELRTFSNTPDAYIDNAIAKGGILCTDPAGARAQLRTLQETMGLDYFIAPTNLGGLDDARVRESMRLFAEEVMPAFQDGEAARTRRAA